MLPEAWRSRACVVYDISTPETWFAPAELAIVAAFKSEKRRHERMLSRIAEKTLRKRGAQGEYVSFSHSGGYGAAAIGEHPIGVDVEVIREIAPRAAHLFLSAGEEAEAQRCTIANALLHFWSAKEAAWKQLGGALPTLKRVPLRLLDAADFGLTFDVVETRRIDGVIVALTRPTS